MKPEAHLRVLGGQFLNRLGSSRVRRNEDRQVTYYGRRSNDVVEARDHPSRHSSRRVPAFINKCCFKNIFYGSGNKARLEAEILP